MENLVNSSDGSETLDENTVSTEKPKLSKEEKIALEKKELEDNLITGQIDNIRDKVAYILNRNVQARNSDIHLIYAYWTTFEHEKMSGSSVSFEQLKVLTKMPSLTRIRAKIQNEYKLFQAHDSVKKHRGKLEEDKRNEALEDKPSGLGVYTVYIDETGKTQDYMSVGSLWSLDFNFSEEVIADRELEKWKKEKSIDFEFHFQAVSKYNIEFYKEFFVKYLSLVPGAGFKLISINNKGFPDKTQAINDLTFHLIDRGIAQEDSSGRAPLPRYLRVCIDEEEKGSDQLKIANIKERLKRQNIKGLYFADFSAVSSKLSFQIQITDLFTGAINRKLNTPDGINVKDDFANFVLRVTNFDITEINKENSQIDSATVFNLSDFKPDCV